MEYKRPSVEEENAIAVYNYIANKTENDGVCTKRELCWKVFGWTYNRSNDRKIRDLISLVANKYPIISLSSSKGYRLAKTKEDLSFVIQQWRENDSRIRVLKDRTKPLMDFYDKWRYEYENN